jgi:hypothetical protein
MSTIKTNTLTGTTSAGSILVTGEGGSTTTNLQQGLAKVWCHFDGQTGSSNDTLNVSGMTDEGTGEHTIGISNDFSNTSYSITTGIAESNTNDNIAILCPKQSAIAVGSLTVYMFAEDSGLFDPSAALACCVTLHGDLA